MFARYSKLMAGLGMMAILPWLPWMVVRGCDGGVIPTACFCACFVAWVGCWVWAYRALLSLGRKIDEYVGITDDQIILLGSHVDDVRTDLAKCVHDHNNELGQLKHDFRAHAQRHDRRHKMQTRRHEDLKEG